MLFIDNPVGAGFSYPDAHDGGPRGYCTNTKQCVADNLYGLIQGFYKIFPDQLKVPLFITGESYGGHCKYSNFAKASEMFHATATL